jgi:hypothetical protein
MSFSHLPSRAANPLENVAKIARRAFADFSKSAARGLFDSAQLHEIDRSSDAKAQVLIERNGSLVGCGGVKNGARTKAGLMA